MRGRTKFAGAHATGSAVRGRTSAALITILFFLIAPGTLAGLVPWWISRWLVLHPPWDPTPVRVTGMLLIFAGAVALAECFARFVRQGRGTPVPLYPTETLVVTGLYRWVRNPMDAAILALLIGRRCGLAMSLCCFIRRVPGWSPTFSSASMRSRRFAARMERNTTPTVPAYRDGSRASPLGRGRELLIF